MRSFFKMFFASLFAMAVFTLLVFFIIVAVVNGLTRKEKAVVDSKAVLVLDLGQQYKEQMQPNPLSVLSGDEERDAPGLYDVIRLIQKAGNDNKIQGILLNANNNANGFAASSEIREALEEFRKKQKFIIAYGDIISQRSYAVANVADKIYLNPQGMLEWLGYSVDLAFLKGTLDKLEIHPQIFYAGKFKSATEPLRSDRMTEANKIQTSAWVNDLYNDLLVKTAAARKVDTATLRKLAADASIRTAGDAVAQHLIDAVKYDDEVKDEIKSRLKIDKYEKIPFISINAYRSAGRYVQSGKEKIALIYAEGNIIDGKGEHGSIGSESYRSMLRKARLDKSIKAIVLRINSGGGSSMASESIWREMVLAKKEKPVIVSFGDVAASGGYYIACGADSIFAQPNTITGSIGVFGIIPNMQDFFRNKLGITFDGVKTSEYADAGTFTRPMNEKEKQIIQEEIDRIYMIFKTRVADGRKRDTAFVDSIAQGRVWTGLRAKDIGLIDKFGGIERAVRSAAYMAKLNNYELKEYPETQTLVQQILGKSSTPLNYADQLKAELGEEQFLLFQQLKKIKEMTNTVQARLPFEFVIR